MMWFHLKRGFKGVITHIILIMFPLLLIIFFDYLYRNTGIETGLGQSKQSNATILALGFALTFQIYGSALSFETLAEDLYSPMHDRLFASPMEGRSLVLSILFSSTIISFLQTLVILLASTFLLEASISPVVPVLGVLLVSVVFHQLLGTLLVFLSKQAKSANVLITIYGSLVPMTLGLYFPLPSGRFFELLRMYGTPSALANTASFALMNADVGLFLKSFVPLLGATAFLFLVLKPLVRRIHV
ncbi:MAG: hypothetical protein AB7C91_03550 [Sphaerochaeta sp.]|uniref:hypothetical protein n=1 Tax=Sphaerochaeta sp. TaxID=1972642 RepID=UPI003D13ECB6